MAKGAADVRLEIAAYLAGLPEETAVLRDAGACRAVPPISAGTVRSHAVGRLDPTGRVLGVRDADGVT